MCTECPHAQQLSPRRPRQVTSQMPQAITVNVPWPDMALAAASGCPAVSTGVELYAGTGGRWWMLDLVPRGGRVTPHSVGGMTIVSPTRITSGLAMLLNSMRASTPTPNFLEML